MAAPERVRVVGCAIEIACWNGLRSTIERQNTQTVRARLNDQSSRGIIANRINEKLKEASEREERLFVGGRLFAQVSARECEIYPTERHSLSARARSQSSASIRRRRGSVVCKPNQIETAPKIRPKRLERPMEPKRVDNNLIDLSLNQRLLRLRLLPLPSTELISIDVSPD